MGFVKVANDTLKGGTSLCLQIQSTDGQRIHFLVTGLLYFFQPISRRLLTLFICCKQDGQSVANKTLMDYKPMPIALDIALDSVEEAVARHNLTIPSISQVWYYLT